MPYLLLAKELRLVHLVPSDGDQKAGEWLFVSKDKDGFDTEPVYLGKVFTDAVNKLDIGSAETLKGYVQRVLNGQEYKSEDKRASLQKAVVAAVEDIKAERGGNLQDETYRLFLDGGKRAVKLLKRET
ncbi:MAG: hypothetical protein H0T86_08235 [Gemmatimonadales bacterium]|nr:hypothetical protein [Gemmatimonadales bacterium]